MALELTGPLKENLLSNCSQFHELVEWNNVSQDCIDSAVSVSGEDIDFISVKGECKQLLENLDVLELIGTPSSRIYKRACIRNVRCCDAKRMLAYANFGDFVFGELLQEETADFNDDNNSEQQEYSEEEEASLDENFGFYTRNEEKYNISRHRESINRILQENSNNDKIPASECLKIIKGLFKNRQVTMFQYGQKLAISNRVIDLVKKLGFQFHVDLAVALQVGKLGEVWMPKMKVNQDYIDILHNFGFS
jgi:hypothetical protein